MRTLRESCKVHLNGRRGVPPKEMRGRLGASSCSSKAWSGAAVPVLRNLRGSFLTGDEPFFPSVCRRRLRNMPVVLSFIIEEGRSNLHVSPSPGGGERNPFPSFLTQCERIGRAASQDTARPHHSEKRLYDLTAGESIRAQRTRDPKRPSP